MRKLLIAGGLCVVAAGAFAQALSGPSPVSAISGLAAGVATWLGTPSSANLATALTDETGSGKVVFDTSPTLVTPTLGAASATSFAVGGALPAAAASTLLLGGVSSNPSFSGDGQGALYLITNHGATVAGRGAVNDVILVNKNGSVALNVPTGTTNVVVPGNLTATGGTAAAGGFSVSPRNFASCGVSAGAATSMFTDQTPVNTEVYTSEVFVPANTTVTGVAIRSGSVASGNVKVGLADVAGNVLKTSASTAVAGAAGVYQRVPFTSTYAAVGPATFYILTFFDNGTVRSSAHTQGNCGAGKLTGQTYATGFVSNASLAPTTFTTALGPVASLY